MTTVELPEANAVPLGFTGGALAAGLKKSGALDLGLIVSDRPCTGAGVFTTNRFPGANIGLCREALARGSMRGIVVHAGQANACTGKEGVRVAERTAKAAAELLGADPSEFVVGSTGVIGVLPDAGKIRNGLDRIVAEGLDADGVLAAGRAMMTTDLVPKMCARTLRLGARKVRLLGMTKGSGMIHPSMATMLAYIVTDAAIPRAALRRMLTRAVDRSFHCLTVDGDTSTSDMVVALANGAAENGKLSEADAAAFERALTEVCRDLARRIARDGEGATRLVTIRVREAVSEADARKVAKTVGSSSLVKTAIFGRDPNWGRIACAVGYSEGRFEPEKVVIRLGKTRIFAAGKPVAHDRPALADYLRNNDEVIVEIRLGAGEAGAEVWTCDFSYDYVRINAEYTT